jgi:multidrug efflux pump subunit AcrB
MKYFKPTNWAIENKIPVYILGIVITIIGIITYVKLPKEQMPDIVIPTIVVQTIHPGTSPTDIENLVTRPIEKQLKSVAGIKRIKSNSISDASIIIVEFRTDITPIIAKQRVQDAVDKSKSDLPDDLLREPNVQEIDFSEFPIMAINIAGDIDLKRLKEYAENMRDKIETFKEITRVDIIGAPEREFQVNVDLYKMNSAGLSFDDIERSIKFQNVNISGGEIVFGTQRRNIRLMSQYKSVDEIRNIILRSASGAELRLNAIAEVRDDFKEKQSFARLNGKSVISLSVIKKSGQNLIDAADQINKYVEEYKGKLPKGVIITITNDMSVYTRTTLADLINTVIIGFVLVTLVLMFFLGLKDSIFVALSVPLASFLAIMIMPTLGFTFNMVVMFAFLLALGIIVDDAIVVIENTHRLFTRKKIPIREAAKLAAAEVFVPVLTGTLTTLAPFIPLLFFPGIAGKFMYFLPVILIITLTASLFVAYIINPMLAVEYMGKETSNRKKNKNLIIVSITLTVFGVIFHLANLAGLGNFLFFLVILGILEKFFVTPILIKGFQSKIQPSMMRFYRRTLNFVLKGQRPYMVFAGTVVLLILVFIIFGMFPPKINFFPTTDPDNIYTYIKMPIGTDAKVTDSVTAIVEEKIASTFNDNEKYMIKSLISNVGIGAGDPQSPDRTAQPHKGKVTVAFVEFEHRKRMITSQFIERFRKSIGVMPGVEIIIESQKSGPPSGKEISIEIGGENLDSLSSIEKNVQKLISAAEIEGIEKLNSDLLRNKPEVLLEVDKVKANSFGISAAQIGMALRSAIFGREATKFRDDKDEYPVQIRLADEYKDNLDAIMNMPITIPEFGTGRIRQIPLASIAKISFTNTFEAINRKNNKRTITLSSNVITGFNAVQVNKHIQNAIKSLQLPEGYDINFTGQKEDQDEASNFLIMAFLSSIALILMILVTQFNSLSKPLIIISQVVFSTIGVFLGFVIFKFTMSIVISGVGIIALMGIVVRNGIVLIDFIDLLHEEKGGNVRKAIARGGSVRFNPVVLTALSAILGMIPLAIGLGIDFGSFFSTGDPKIFLGGFTAAFWGPLAWAIIFGLTFATFITLVVVPCMYFIQYAFKVKWDRRKELKAYRESLLEN